MVSFIYKMKQKNNSNQIQLLSSNKTISLKNNTKKNESIINKSKNQKSSTQNNIIKNTKNSKLLNYDQINLNSNNLIKSCSNINLNENNNISDDDNMSEKSDIDLDLFNFNTNNNENSENNDEPMWEEITFNDMYKIDKMFGEEKSNPEYCVACIYGIDTGSSESRKKRLFLDISLKMKKMFIIMFTKTNNIKIIIDQLDEFYKKKVKMLNIDKNWSKRSIFDHYFDHTQDEDILITIRKNLSNSAIDNTIKNRLYITNGTEIRINDDKIVLENLKNLLIINNMICGGEKQKILMSKRQQAEINKLL